jgi:hypothetical protein
MGLNDCREVAIADELDMLESGVLAETGDQEIEEDVSHCDQIVINGRQSIHMGGFSPAGIMSAPE